jgi:hypothetical protein
MKDNWYSMTTLVLTNEWTLVRGDTNRRGELDHGDQREGVGPEVRFDAEQTVGRPGPLARSGCRR